MKPQSKKYVPCDCIHYESETGEVWGSCTCGHSPEEHRPGANDPPGDRSCKGSMPAEYAKEER